MVNIFFTSDLHLFDNDIAQYRGFKDYHEYHSLLEQNWNQVVTRAIGDHCSDVVYILGDISKNAAHDALKWMYMHLNGFKILIPGNHDSWGICKGFEALGGAVMTSHIIKNGERRYLLTHHPVHPNEFKWYDGNIHGHIHAPYPEIKYFPTHYPEPDDSGKYRNVNVEFNKYTPVKLEDIYFKFQQNKDEL